MSIRISEENLALIHQKATKAKLNFTDYVTRACLGKHIVIIEGLDEILKEQKAILRVFIRKIQVFEKTEKYSRTAGNLINIHYAFQLLEQDGMSVLEMLLPSNMRETA